MKKTRKILSIVLAVIFAFGSMPAVHISTGAADAVAYATEETGTLENPTRPVEASGNKTDPDAYKMLYEIYNLDYTFYQTQDDEYFNLTQVFNLKQYDDGDVNLYLQTAGLYYGETEATQDGSYEISAGYGRIEYPRITTNPTTDFVNNYLVGSADFVAVNDSAANIQGAEKGLIIAGGDNPPLYTWNLPITFKGRADSVSGEINTGYYVKATWEWYDSDGNFGAHYEMNIGATIRVLDAREFVKELAKVYEVVENPENYTQAYVSAAQAILNDIPDDLENLSAVYDQSVIDEYTEAMKNRSLNAADYTEYNQTYTALSAITNAKGAYTEKSYQAFVEEITAINSKLPKTLDKTMQSTVDAANQALKDAYEKLVFTDLSDTDTPYSYDAGDGKDIIINFDNTAFCFMQTKDNQEFSYEQNVLIYRDGGSTARQIRGIILDESGYHGSSTCCDSSVTSAGTTNFLTYLDSSCYASTSGYADENDTSVTAKEFTCVTETKNSNWRSNQAFDTNFVTSDGRFGYKKTLDDYGILGSGPFEYRSAVIAPVFKGNSVGTYGELNLSYTLRTGFSTNSGIGYSGTQWHTHTLTTIQVTDVRQLISAVDSAEAIVADSENYSDSYIANLKAAIKGIPIEMLRGVEYYTQVEVDALYNQVNTVLTTGETEEGALADYSEYAKVLEMMMSVDNQSLYTDESYDIFEEKVYEINKNLDKSLPASEQATVDAAVDALYNAYKELEFYEVGDDNIFSTDDITEDLGYNTLYFELSNTEYTFMQVYDGQKFALSTELYLESTNDNYDTAVYNLEYSMVKAGDTTCAERGESADKGCHNLENIIVPEGVSFTDEFLGVVSSGVTTYEETETGTIGKNTNWVFDEERSTGASFVSDGIIVDGAEITTNLHYATSDIICNGFSGGISGAATGYEAIYSWRLGWGYREQHFLDSFVNFSETIKRHVHIPVSVKLTDARALNALYGESDDILNGRTDKSYTFASLLNLYNTFNTIDSDMAYGNEYYTQEQVNEAYAELSTAYAALEEGADYSDYFKAYVQAEEIINSGNTDSRGNALYDEATFTKFVDVTTSVHENLDKNLAESEQATVDTATARLNEALSALEAGKNADYSALNDAMTEAEKIFAEEEANPGTYTEATLEAIRTAYEAAEALQNADELPASEQATVDAVASALQAAIEDKEYKADYSDFDEAYTAVEEIANDTTGKYTDATIQAAKDAIAQADALDKDLADTAANREAIKTVTDALNNVADNAEEKADYTEYENAKAEADALINAGATDENGNSIYADGAFDAYKEAVNNIDSQLNKDLSVDNQATVDEATSALEEAMQTLENNKLADYTEFNAAKDALEEIVNNPDDYTSASVEAAQKALDSVSSIPDGLPVGENNQYQNIIDNATASMNQVLGAVEERADYTEFDKAYEQIEDILNNPDKYTEETVQAAQTAKDAADQVGTDQPLSNQEIVNQITEAMNQVVENKQEYADYTDYNNAKAAADEIINAGNTDENGNPIYNEDAYNAYVEAVNKIDSELPKNLTSDYQSTVDEAAEALKDLRTELDASSMDYDEVVIDPETAVDDTTVQDIVDEVIKDLTENQGYTEDEIVVEFKDYLGNELAGEAFVGTGSTMRVILKSTGELLEYKLFIVMGDVDGNGQVNDADYNKAINVALEEESYPDENYYFFKANDMDEDGVADVIDVVLIGRIYK